MPETDRAFRVITAAEAYQAGWTPSGLSRAVRKGELRRVNAGTYMAQAAWSALTPEDQHLATSQARLLMRGAEWATARRTAALLHGLDLLGKPPSRPQLLRPGPRSAKASSRHERVATLPADHVIEVHGMRATTVARTVVDLARAESFRSAVVAADSALRLGVTPPELAEVLRFCRSWPGAATAARVIAFADGRSESVLESISRVAMRLLGLPVFEPQVEIFAGDRMIARVDGFWREWNLVGEADGQVKYDERADLYAEKRRQDDLEDHGLTVVRWDWDDAWRPQGVLDDRVRRGRARAAGRRLDPRLRFRSTTLEEAWIRRQWASRAA